MTSDEIIPDFLAALFRTRYYRRAFRAITTGHSNRRRTQTIDFEDIDVCFPPDKEVQKRLIRDIMNGKINRQKAEDNFNKSMSAFSNLIDSRGEDDIFVEEDDEVE